MTTHGTSPTNATMTRAKAVTTPAPAFAKPVGEGEGVVASASWQHPVQLHPYSDVDCSHVYERNKSRHICEPSSSTHMLEQLAGGGGNGGGGDGGGAGQVYETVALLRPSTPVNFGELGKAHADPPSMKTLVPCSRVSKHGHKRGSATQVGRWNLAGLRLGVASTHSLQEDEHRDIERGGSATPAGRWAVTRVYEQVWHSHPRRGCRECRSCRT